MNVGDSIRSRVLRVVVVATALLASGCGGTPVVAPVGRVETAPARTPAASGGSYTVRAGDTLYSIAWTYGLDYRDVAAVNRIPEPYTIYPGERVRIPSEAEAQAARAASAPSSDTVEVHAVPDVGPVVVRTVEPARAASAPSAATSRAPPPAPTTTAKASPPSASAAPAARAAAPSPTASRPRTTRASVAPASRSAPSSIAKSSGALRWQWPTKGKVIGVFAHAGSKGVDIAGKEGQPIVAASDGKVVYSGGGLIGYGKLIIVKHDERFLSAYAHNDKVLVKEGDVVKAGQHIADMGRTGTDRVKLHFEIRRDGRPVDPLRYLPR